MLSLFNDPFTVSDPFFSDPFFTGYTNYPQGQRQGGRRRGGGGGASGAGDQRLAQAGQQQGGGVWDFNQLLQTPIVPSLKEEDKQYVMQVQRPQGLSKEDLHIEVNENMLTISGEHKEEKKDEKSGRQSRSAVSFSRSMLLPENVDHAKISAAMQPDGTLQVLLPKVEGAEGKKRAITIA